MFCINSQTLIWELGESQRSQTLPKWFNNQAARPGRKKQFNTPGTAGGTGDRDRTLAVKNLLFFVKKKKYLNFFFCIYLLMMPKYWVTNYFTHGRFPEVGQKQKTEKKKKKKEERKLVITMAKLRMAHASTHGARKPPGPKAPYVRSTVALRTPRVNNTQALKGLCLYL